MFTNVENIIASVLFYFLVRIVCDTDIPRAIQCLSLLLHPPVTGRGSGRRLLRLQAEEPLHNAGRFKQHCHLNPTLDFDPLPRVLDLLL